MEGSQALVKRAVENATHNGLQDKVSYEMANLFEVTPESFAALGKFDKMLVDPPRDGAIQLLKAMTDDTAPQRIVYVSCNPATLARDANVLVNTKGYTSRRQASLTCSRTPPTWSPLPGSKKPARPRA
jgi:23S rRNA (uracil1939-C5)-methyltransferase